MRPTLFAAMLLASSALQAQTATFSAFHYQGEEQRFQADMNPATQYFNPILAGYSPDPSICRKGDTYYLVNSSFSFFPGVPIYTSKDLVSWKQLGYVLDRPSQLPLDGQNVSGGIFAPAISYNEKNKTFYMITTNVGRGNFFVKTTDPAKGWSEPIYLPKIDGIDPAFFFDKNGDGYIVHNGPVDGGADYEGQRAIRIFRFDTKGDSIVGDYKQIVRGGTHVQERPIWIEGPHIYRVGKYYYLMCAEGGTGDWHSEVIFRAKNPMGPWEEYAEGNPILTQRTGLDPKRTDIVTSAGHADLVQTEAGDWWAVFLACRPYEADYYNTGRDTYLLPVTWTGGWPTILEKGKAIPTVNEKSPWQQKLATDDWRQWTGNYTYHDDFKGSELGMRWTTLRRKASFYTLTDNGVAITPQPTNISEKGAPSALFFHQAHTNFTTEVTLDYKPQQEQDLAGLALLQNERYNMVYGKTLRKGKTIVTLSRSRGEKVELASVELTETESRLPLKLKIVGRGRYYDFLYATGNGAWQTLTRGVDAVCLSTHDSGGFIGACIGLYATSKKD